MLVLVTRRVTAVVHVVSRRTTAVTRCVGSGSEAPVLCPKDAKISAPLRDRSGTFNHKGPLAAGWRRWRRLTPPWGRGRTGGEGGGAARSGQPPPSRRAGLSRAAPAPGPPGRLPVTGAGECQRIMTLWTRAGNHEASSCDPQQALESSMSNIWNLALL